MKLAFLRFRRMLLQLLICVDQLAQILIFSIPYIVGGGPMPSADETISSVVGRHAIAGYRWALIAEKIINPIFAVLGDHDHCRKSIEEIKGR